MGEDSEQGRRSNAMIVGYLTRLRGVERDDLLLLSKWRNSPEVYEFLFERDPVSCAQQERWFSLLLEKNDRRCFIIETRGAHAMGFIQLFRIDWRNRNADWGFYIGESEYRMGGYAAEAEFLLLRYAFRHLNLHRVYCETFAFNVKVLSMHRRFGFVEEGRLREHIYRDGRYEDVVITGLTEHEFCVVERQMEALFRRLSERMETSV